MLRRLSFPVCSVWCWKALLRSSLLAAWLLKSTHGAPSHMTSSHSGMQRSGSRPYRVASATKIMLKHAGASIHRARLPCSEWRDVNDVASLSSLSIGSTCSADSILSTSSANSSDIDTGAMRTAMGAVESLFDDGSSDAQSRCSLHSGPSGPRESGASGGSDVILLRHDPNLPHWTTGLGLLHPSPSADAGFVAFHDDTLPTMTHPTPYVSTAQQQHVYAAQQQTQHTGTPQHSTEQQHTQQHTATHSNPMSQSRR
mmetsp:Transcript_34414/g.74338  ORF Transcript_34414/g.74338 Transcript_34414/m.74338 type:complete len:256 (+) Transcript_34414:245-1012(+)